MTDQPESAGMSVALPEPLEDHFRQRAANGRFSDPGEYIRALIRADMERGEG
jgi:Arc/MetJ-type ribon-helix-helix transcriptional regulator